MRAVLSNDGKWVFPKVAGVIMTPTLRPDGSLLDTPGYDPSTELYLSGALQLPPISPRPTRDEALDALATLKDLFSEFPFKTSARLLGRRRGASVRPPARIDADGADRPCHRQRIEHRQELPRQYDRRGSHRAALPRLASRRELGRKPRRSSAPSCSAAPRSCCSTT